MKENKNNFLKDFESLRNKFIKYIESNSIYYKVVINQTTTTNIIIKYVTNGIVTYEKDDKEYTDDLSMFSMDELYIILYYMQ